MRTATLQKFWPSFVKKKYRDKNRAETRGMAISQVNLGQWKSMLFHPCVTSIFVIMAILFMGPFDNESCSWEKRLTVHRGHNICLVTEILIWWSHLLMSICTKCKYLYILTPFSKMYPHSPSKDVHYFSNPALSRSLTIQKTHEPQLINHWTIAQLTIFLPYKMFHHVYWTKLCSLWRFPFASVFQDCPRTGL